MGTATDQAVTDDWLAAARRRGFLGRLSPELVDEIVASSRALRYPKGAESFPPGDAMPPAIVVSGLLRSYLSTASGRQTTIRYAGVGDLVGSLSGERTALSTGFQATVPSVLLHIDQAQLEALARLRPQLAWELVEELTRRLRLTYLALAAAAFAPVRARVARDLLERARAADQVRAGARLEVTAQALADATGSVRDVVARAIRDLRNDGAIATHSSVISIVDPGKLIAQAQAGA
jgi:CRP/FNR family cyclic AMP-dependent transcriptional regulator